MTADANSLLSEHLNAFNALYDEAEAHAASGDFEQAARAAQAAADLAWYNHTGFFTSHRLERLLGDIAASLPAVAPTNARPGSKVERVLHVLTEAHEEAGGHIRLAWRWVQSDSSRHHSAVATNHPGHWPLSATLSSAVEASGGSISQLNVDRSEPLLRRAERLRQMASEFDCLALHIHPYDVVPLIAFSGAERPPIIFLNHADHVFWLGTSIADTLACRPPGAALAQERRGLTPGHLSLLPQTIDAKEQKLSKEVAKRGLGIDTDLVVILGATASYKLSPVDEYDFLAMTADALAQREDCVMILIVAGDTTHLQGAIDKANGRIALLPRQDNLTPFYDAADIFLNPYPFPSMTAFLEAGMHHAAVIGFNPQASSDVLSATNFYTDGVVLEPTSPQGYQGALARLIEDGDYRRRQADALNDLVKSTHTSPRWNNWLEHCYADAISAFPASPSSLADEPRQERIDKWLVTMHERGSMLRTVSYVRQTHGLGQSAESVASPTPSASPAAATEMAADGLSVVTVVGTGDIGFVEALQQVLDSNDGRALQFIAVDNGSTGEIAAALQELTEDIDVVRSETVEPALEAWIAGIGQAQHELVLLLSTDVRLPKGWLPPALNTLAGTGQPVAVELKTANGQEVATAGPVQADGVCLLLTRTLLAGDLPDAAVSQGPAATVVRRP